MNIKQSSTVKPDSESELLTVPELALVLRLKVSTIRAWVLQRRIPYVKLNGKRVLFRRSDVEALVTASVVPATASRERTKKGAA